MIRTLNTLWRRSLLAIQPCQYAIPTLNRRSFSRADSAKFGAQGEGPTDEPQPFIIGQGRKCPRNIKREPATHTLRSHLDNLVYIPLYDHTNIFSPAFSLQLPNMRSMDYHLLFGGDKKQYVFVSVIKNEILAKKCPDTIFEEKGKIIILPQPVPFVMKSTEVFQKGFLCLAQMDPIESNGPFGARNLTLFPQSVGKVTTWLQEPSPFGVVKIEECLRPQLFDYQLDIEQQIILSKVKEEFLAIFLGRSMLQESQIIFFERNINRFIMWMARALHWAFLRDQDVLYPNSIKINSMFQLLLEEQNITKALGLLKEMLTSLRLRRSVKVTFEHKLSDSMKEAEIDNEKSTDEEAEEKRPEGKKGKPSPKPSVVGDIISECIASFQKNLVGKTLPDAIAKKVAEEIKKFSQIDAHNPESNVIRTYLSFLTALPWGTSSKDDPDIEAVKKVLENDHYGMEDIKKRILEFVAVGKLRGKLEGKILCFVGPPGVGKTSIGESIARSVKRSFYRISVGGDRDTATLKGFRRTYVGAIPGKIAQALKNTQVENPVILIDEVDKLSARSHHGDPSSVLLEVLDPEQNSKFVDDYLDVPLNLSKVLFLCTANTTHTIPKMLLDRMEVIHVSGYTHAEKVHILEKFIKPKLIEKAGLKGNEDKFKITDEATTQMIEDYCREPGVRGLQRAYKRITEKIALQLVKGKTKIVVDTTNLEEFIGIPPFSIARIYPETPVGVACGLAYTELGGQLIFIETRESLPSKSTQRNRGSGIITLTGSLGDVMKESVSIAHTLSKNFLYTHFPNHTITSYFEDYDIHIHLPAGAIQKEGPSAGITLAISLLSLALNEPVTQDFALTGEITLSGKILPIGGVKEKVLAAQREGIKNVVLPKQNEKDWEKLPEFLKKETKVHFAEEFSEVFRIMFPNIPID